MVHRLPTYVSWLVAALAASFIPAAIAAEPLPWRDVNRRAAGLVGAQQYREAELVALAGLKGCPDAGVEQSLCASILLQNAADAEVALGKAAEAEANYRQSLAVRRQALPPGHPLTADSAMRLGVFLQQRRRSLEAEPLLAEAAEAFRLAGPRAAEPLLAALSWQVSALAALDRIGDAVMAAEEAQAVAVRERGEGSLDALTAISNRIGVLRLAARPDEALDLALATLARPAATTYPPRWRVKLAGQAAQAAQASLRSGAARDATAAATSALALVDAGAADPDAAVTLLLGLSRLARDTGEHGVAATYAARAETAARAAYGPRHEDVATAMSDRGLAELARGNPQTALPLLDESAAISGGNGKALARIDALTAAARALFASGQPDAAAARLYTAVHCGHGPDARKRSGRVTGVSVLENRRRLGQRGTARQGREDDGTRRGRPRGGRQPACRPGWSIVVRSGVLSGRRRAGGGRGRDRAGHGPFGTNHRCGAPAGGGLPPACRSAPRSA